MKVVRGYTHHDGSIGVLAQFEIGSDFTARTGEFKMLADGVLMSIAAHCRDGYDDVWGGDGVLALNGCDLFDAPWVGDGEAETIGSALDAASMIFREKISVETVAIVLDGVDRRPKVARVSAANGEP